MASKKKMIASILVAFLVGLGGGYCVSKYQSQIEWIFVHVKTWHIVTTFNLTMNNDASPTFFVSGEKWRITWETIVPSASEMTGSNVDFGEISILIYNESSPNREFAVRSFIWLDLSMHDVHTMGVHYVYEGRGYYFIELRSIVLLPLALTVDFIIESYY